MASDHTSILRCAMRPLAVSLLLCASTFALGERPALAAPSAAERETARGLMTDGDRKYIAHDYAASLEAYKGADAIMHVPTTGMAVARSLAALGRLVEARDAAVAVVRMPLEVKEPAAFGRARTAAEQLAAELLSRIPSIQITVSGVPANTTLHVTLDGEPVPTEVLNLPRKTNPGHHVVATSAPGFDERSSEVTLKEGETATVALALSAGVVAEPRKGSTTPASTSNAFLDAAPTSKRHPLYPLVYAGFGVGAAGLVTGSIAGLIHLGQVKSVRTNYCMGGSNCESGYQAALDADRPSAIVADVAFGLGAAGIAAGVVGLFLHSGSSEPAPSASAKVSWTPTLDGRSIGVAGRF